MARMSGARQDAREQNQPEGHSADRPIESVDDQIAFWIRLEWRAHAARCVGEAREHAAGLHAIVGGSAVASQARYSGACLFENKTNNSK
eukprot:scaffold2354_cov124-Isochrysis_galbana.AAC.5